MFPGLVRGGRGGRASADGRSRGEVVAAAVGDVNHEVIWRDRGILGGGAGGTDGSVEPRSEVLNIELDVVHDAAQRDLVVVECGRGLAVVSFACVIESFGPIVRRARHGGRWPLA